MSTTKTVQEMTTKELEELIAARKKKEQAQREKAKTAYEEKRNETVMDIMQKAIQLRNELESFKEYCHLVMEEQALALENYGGLSKKSKGGFSITDDGGNFRVVRRRDTEPNWDERSTKAVELIREFLGDAVKKRDLDLYEILMSFLERNANGDMEYGRVMNLLQHEGKFNDTRWTEGLALLKQSYTTHLKAYGYEFKSRNTQSGKWESQTLNFSSL